jgi:hypothetical protein
MNKNNVLFVAVTVFSVVLQSSLSKGGEVGASTEGL